MTVKELIGKNTINGHFQIETYDMSKHPWEFGWNKILTTSESEAIEKYGDCEIKEWYAESDYDDNTVTISIEI